MPMPPSSSPPPVAVDGLERGSCTQSGVYAHTVESFLNEVAAAGLEMHALMLHRHGKVVAEGYVWPYRADRPQIMHSVAKSFTACAVGLAIEAGAFNLSDKVISFFPDDVPDVINARLGAMTVEDLLTMRSGHGSEVGGPAWRAIKTSWIKEFFKIPLMYDPGSTYVYSSSSSYMLAAILYRTTGLTLHDYLRPRLFEPLGITGETWDIGPDKFNPGGNGLTCKLSDILKLGILHVQGGIWQGRRLLPADWVAKVGVDHTGKGYGYHWWPMAHNSYAAVGQFMQMVIAFPQHDATLAFTASIDRMESLQPFIFRHFPAAFAPEPLTHEPGHAIADQALARRLEVMGQRPGLESVVTPLNRPDVLTYRMDDNPLGISAFRLAIAQDHVEVGLDDAEGHHSLTCGLDGWLEGESTMPGRDLHHGYRLDGAVVVAGAHFIDATTLELIWCFAGTAFRDRVLCRFEGTGITIERTVSVNSGATAWPMLTGRLTWLPES